MRKLLPLFVLVQTACAAGSIRVQTPDTDSMALHSFYGPAPRMVAVTFGTEPARVALPAISPDNRPIAAATADLPPWIATRRFASTVARRTVADESFTRLFTSTPTLGKRANVGEPAPDPLRNPLALGRTVGVVSRVSVACDERPSVAVSPLLACLH